jgi:hypothetical protein
MSLYQWSQNDEQGPQIYGTEDHNYTRDLTTDQYHNIDTRLPYGSATSRTIEGCFNQFGKFYGTAPDDLLAQNKFEEWTKNSFSNLDVPHILDIIINMPAGMRTSDELSRLLRQFPLGLLSALLKKRIEERGFTRTLFKQFFYSGRINRIINEPISRHISDDENSNTLSTRVEKDISSIEDVFNFPISKFEFSVPYATLDPKPTEDGDILSKLLVTPNEGEAVTQFLKRIAYSKTGQLIDFNLHNYVNEVTRASGGSDKSFFLFGENGHITKRFEVYNNRNNSISVKRARSIRSAGLRQVLLEDYIDEFSHMVNTTLQYTKVFLPGGIRNCFLACIRWAYVQVKRDAYVSSMLEEMEFAQDSDMLSSSSSVVSFDEEECFLKIDKIIEAIVSLRAKFKNIEVKEYMKSYRNGFTSVELSQICALFYYDYGIEIFYWKISSYGKWHNIISCEKETVDPPPCKLVLFQLNDTGNILNIQLAKREIEESVLVEGIENGELGHMTHAAAVFPVPFYFAQNNPDIAHRVTRKRFSVAFNEKTSLYVSSVYEKLNYDQNISHGDILKLVSFQNYRYRLKETRTLIFDLPSYNNPVPPEAKRLCFGFGTGNNPLDNMTSDVLSRKGRLLLSKINLRETPRIWVFAYDLETVRNTSSIQHLVYPPFQKPSIDIMTYELQDCQIPFSFQYIGVNVEDSGNFLQRKVENEIKPLVYPRGHSKYDCYISEKPTTIYGSSLLLGECIEEALCSIANYVHSQKGEQAYLFAVNGSKFDALITILYHRFEMTHILKTSRGVLTVSLRVPIIKPPPSNYNYANDDNPKITIKLRDLSLLVPGSLSRLCKGFDVPKEYTKLDFPIQMVNANNCYNSRIRTILQEYGENDVLSLAWIIRKINDLIGNSMWNPAEIRSDRPPITQFVTCMGMIRKSTKSHFDKYLPLSLQPKAIDIPALRCWLIQSAIGGRVTAYAKTYASSFTNDILKAALRNDTLKLQDLYSEMVILKQCMQCLDVTSLYPFVMNSCPLPMGGLHSLDAVTCNNQIDMIHCEQCESLRTLCSTHHYQFTTNDSNLRPFSIILIKNIKFEGKSHKNLCPRKTYSSSTSKVMGLIYSLESNEEYTKRYDGKETLNEVSAYSNIDLYWMRKQGFKFDIIGGFGFHTLMVYNTFIGPAFQNRIEAKKAGNKLLSDFLKLNYNGAYGITIQQDILDSFFLAKIPSNLHNRDPRDSEIRNCLYSISQHHQNREGITCSEELTGEAFYFPNGQGCFQKRKKEHLAEYFSEQSPMQIGTAILAYARHIGNLILFDQDELDYTYTDTDSFTIGENIIQSDVNLHNLICNRDDAPMGTLKNDHAENNGTDPKIFLSLIGGKKVKGHFTLNKEGCVKIFNTFKGLHVSCDIDGKKINPAFAEYITTKVLLDVNIKNYSEPVIVQSWRRNLQHGVSIANHLQVLDSNTYFDDYMGVKTIDRMFGKIEYFVPFGSEYTEDGFTFNRVITTDEQKKDYEIPRNINDFYDLELLSSFIELYYEGCDKEYNPGTDEYNEILSLFEE